MFRKTILVLATISAAVALVVFAAIAGRLTSAGTGWRADAPAAVAAGRVAAGQPIVGEFTGAYVDGAPVYRLPPIVVSVDRKAELARIEREQRQAEADRESLRAYASGAMPEAVHTAVAAHVVRK